MEKEIKITLILAILLFAFASCKKFVQVYLPQDRVIASAFLSPMQKQHRP